MIESPRAMIDEFRVLDSRPIHHISEIITLDELRKQQALEKDPHQGFQPKKGQGSRTLDEATVVLNPALLAAKQQLMHDKPSIIEKMEKAMGQVDVSKQNRSYRLNSLGVFESDVNEVRARSMQRVELHKGLSTTSMRLNNYPTKDVKSTVPDESVVARLEKMYTRVLKSLDPQPSKRPSSRAQGVSKQNSRITLPSLPLVRPSLAQVSYMEPASPCSPLGRLQTEKSRTARSPQFDSSRSLRIEGSWKAAAGSSPSTMHRNIAPNASSRGHQSLDWSKLSLPPEVALAQAQHIAALTEKHQDMYHKAVLGAQTAMVLGMGLDSVMIHMTAEQLDAYLTDRALQMGLESSLFDPNDPKTKEVSQKIIAPKNLPEMLGAAVKHTEIMSSELQGMQEDLEHSSWSSPAKLANFKRRLAHAGNGGYQLSEDGDYADDCEPGRMSDRPSKQMPVDKQASSSRSMRTNRSGCTDGGSDEVEGVAHVVPVPDQGIRTVSAMGVPATVSAMGVPAIIDERRIEQFKARLADGVTIASKPGFCVPKIKPIPDLPESTSPSQHLQLRLERLWLLLSIPLPLRCDMVLTFSKKERANQFGEALDVWEEAAAAIAHREELLRQIKSMQGNIAGGSVGHVSVLDIERLAVGLLQTNKYLLRLIDHLEHDFGGHLTVHGKPYPGEVTDESDLLAFFMWISTYKGPVCIFP